MEDFINIVNESLSGHPTNDYSSVFQSNYFLFGFTMFVDLLIAMVTMVVFYDTTKSLLVTRRATRSMTSPINVYKVMVMCASLALFLRSIFDAIILVTWGELNVFVMKTLHNMDKVFDILSVVPILGFVYILLRAGPVIEFQLLRLPIPTELHPTWRMLKKPLTSIGLIILLSVVITISK